MLEDASHNDVVTFCLPDDDDTRVSYQPSCPAGFNIDGLYRVGSAYGNEWPSGEVRRERRIDFFLPGQIVDIDKTKTDSNTRQSRFSAAPATAAGLAAVIIECVDIAEKIWPTEEEWERKQRYSRAIKDFVQYLSNRQDAVQNLSIGAGWAPFSDVLSGSNGDSEHFARLLPNMLRSFNRR